MFRPSRNRKASQSLTAFSQLTPASLERLVASPYTLKTRNLSPIGTFVLYDFVGGDFHSMIDVARKHFVTP